MNAVDWKLLVRLTSHFDMALIPLRFGAFYWFVDSSLKINIAVWRLTWYPMQDIDCECHGLKTACQINFTFWYGLDTTKTSNAIGLGHSKKNKMAASEVGRLTLYHIQNIACERGSLKTAQLILDILWKQNGCHNRMTVISSSIIHLFNDFITIVFNPNISRTLDKTSLDLIYSVLLLLLCGTRSITNHYT